MDEGEDLNDDVDNLEDRGIHDGAFLGTVPEAPPVVVDHRDRTTDPAKLSNGPAWVCRASCRMLAICQRGRPGVPPCQVPPSRRTNAAAASGSTAPTGPVIAARVRRPWGVGAG